MDYRDALKKRAQEIAGKDLEASTQTAGMGDWGDDYWDRNNTEAPDWQGQAEPDADVNMIDTWRQGDYANSPVGPNGDTLPPGALGWDYNGEPYYGEGIQGWWNGFVSRMTAPLEETKTTGPYLPPGVPANAANLETYKDAQAPNGAVADAFKYVGRFGKELVGGVLGLLGTSSKAVEQGVGMYLQGEQLGEGSPLPSLSDVADKLPKFAGDFLQGAAFANPMILNGYNNMRMLTAPGFNKNFEGETLQSAVGDALGGKIPFVQQGSQLDAAWKAGRIAYSAVINPLAMQEYTRRYQAGENPTLLQQQLENPWAEFIGQFAFDPLNFVGVGAKVAKEGKQIVSAADEFLAVGDDVAKWLASSDADAISKLDDLAKLQIGKAEEVAADIANWSTKHGLFDLTATGKRYVFTRKVSTVANTILANSKDVDEAMGAMEALVKLGSKNADEVAEGLTFAKHFTAPRLLLGQAGDELGLTLRKLMTDANGTLDASKFINGLKDAQKGGVDSVVKYATEKLAKATDGLFPTLGERLKAGEQLTALDKALVKFDNTTHPVYSKLNSFFANVYMGYSPGFAFRNAISNMEHIGIDDGGKAVLSMFRPSENKSAIAKMLGYTKSVEGFGVQASAGVKATAPMTKFSGKIEEAGALAVQRRTIERVMERMLSEGRGLPSVTSLVDAGMGKEAASALLRAVLDNGGDVRTASAAVMEGLKTGSLDVIDAMTWIGKGEAKTLREFGLYDEVTKAIREGRQGGKSLEEIRTAVTKLYDDFAGKAKASTLEDLGGVASDSPAAGDVLLLDKARQAGVIDDVAVDLAMDHRQANTNAWEAAREAITRMIDGAMAEANASGDAARLADMKALQAKYVDFRGASNEWAIGRAVKQAVNDFQERWAGQWITAVEREHGTGKLNMAARWDELTNAARQFGIDMGDAPKSWGEFRGKFWQDFHEPVTSKHWNALREKMFQAAEDVYKQIGNTQGSDILIKNARKAYKEAQMWDDFIPPGRLKFQLATAIDNGQNANAARIYAHQFGIASKSTSGADLDGNILRIINANSDTAFKSLDDIPPEAARAALLQHVKKEKLAGAVTRPPRPYNGGMPSPGRVVTEQLDGLTGVVDNLLKAMSDNWGRTEAFVPKDKKALEAAIKAWETQAAGRVAEIRTVASAVADANRDFTLLSYPQKRGIDLVLSYVYPYQFWYSRTYANWVKRIASSPEVIAGYAKYKDLLSKIHAGLPEWWKYNINSNELLGLESDNPVYFNLEASLNPLNGLTGVDFDDPDKRVDWWTSTLDAMGKLGPSTWTPLSIATALALYMQGKQDAAARWGGRLIPQTASIKSLSALLNVGPKGGLELDPAVHFFSGGLDVYERNRVGRALGMLVSRGEITQEQAIDAAYTQTGQYWDMAKELATDLRAPGQLSSFFLGVGFKGRTSQDMQIDQMYSEMNFLRAMKPNMSADEYSKAWDGLKQKYTFMDAVLMSRKGGPERDEAFAWSVLNRIPPGQKDDLVKAVGLDYRLMEKFYNNKGDTSTWAATDRDRFLSAMRDLGALLAMPDDATKTEWQAASRANKAMYAEMQGIYGSDILDLIDDYYAAKDGTLKGQDRANDLLAKYPQIGQALDWKTQAVMENELLAKYYSSVNTVESYYRNKMYTEAEAKFGPDIREIESAYFDAPNGKAYLREHPELKEYWSWKDEYRQKTSSAIVDAVFDLPEGAPLDLRPDADKTSLGAQDLIEAMNAPVDNGAYDYTWEDWTERMDPALSRVVEDYILDGERLSYASEKKLKALAKEEGITYEVMMELISRGLQ